MFFSSIQRMKQSWVEDTTEYTPSKLTREHGRLGHEKVPHVVLYNACYYLDEQPSSGQWRRFKYEDDPELGQSRLLEADNRVDVPAKTHWIIESFII